jgi:hypothetical protein
VIPTLDTYLALTMKKVGNMLKKSHEATSKIKKR